MSAKSSRERQKVRAAISRSRKKAPRKGWRHQAPTAAQLETAQNMLIPVPPGATRGEVADMIRLRCSKPRQPKRRKKVVNPAANWRFHDQPHKQEQAEIRRAHEAGLTDIYFALQEKAARRR